MSSGKKNALVSRQQQQTRGFSILTARRFAPNLTNYYHPLIQQQPRLLPRLADAVLVVFYRFFSALFWGGILGTHLSVSTRAARQVVHRA